MKRFRRVRLRLRWIGHPSDNKRGGGGKWREIESGKWVD
jgi:hypothetical protein